MQLNRQLTVKGIQGQVYDYLRKYFPKLGYTAVDARPDFFVMFKKKLSEGAEGRWELWLTISIIGESYVNVFLDYQTRIAENDDGAAWVDEKSLVRLIDREYHALWENLNALSASA